MWNRLYAISSNVTVFPLGVRLQRNPFPELAQLSSVLALHTPVSALASLTRHPGTCLAVPRRAVPLAHAPSHAIPLVDSHPQWRQSQAWPRGRLRLLLLLLRLLLLWHLRMLLLQMLLLWRLLLRDVIGILLMLLRHRHGRCALRVE